MSYMQNCLCGGIDLEKLQHKLVQSFRLLGAYMKGGIERLVCGRTAVCSECVDAIVAGKISYSLIKGSI